jgi:hypothetical protein
MKEKIKKIKVSKEQFAEVLNYWLLENSTKKVIKEMAKELRFKIRNNKDFSKIFEELFIFNMWLIVYTCEGVFENEEKRNECLDIFHNLVYSRHIENKEISFNDWMMSISQRYIEYSKAMETEHPSTPLWVVANKVNKRFFGEIKKDPFINLKIASHIGAFIKYLGELIKKYEIN